MTARASDLPLRSAALNGPIRGQPGAARGGAKQALSTIHLHRSLDRDALLPLSQQQPKLQPKRDEPPTTPRYDLCLSSAK